MKRVRSLLEMEFDAESVKDKKNVDVMWGVFEVFSK